jgi:hypothetical protein
MAQYSSVTVSGHLPLYVEWLQSKPTKTVSYNPTTRIVTWDIGLVSSSLESDPALYFQVGIKPSRQQIGSSPVLVDSVIVGGKNVDSGVLGQIKKQDHTTTLRSDTIDSFGSVVSGDEADGGVFKNQ